MVLTRNLAIERLRAERADLDGQRRGDGEAWRLSAAETDDPAEAMRTFDPCDRVRIALQTLPVMQRIAIEMTYFEGLSQEEVANCLEQPLATVKTRIRGALLKLRAALTWEGR